MQMPCRRVRPFSSAHSFFLFGSPLTLPRSDRTTIAYAPRRGGVALAYRRARARGSGQRLCAARGRCARGGVPAAYVRVASRGSGRQRVALVRGLRGRSPSTTCGVSSEAAMDGRNSLSRAKPPPPPPPTLLPLAAHIRHEHVERRLPVADERQNGRGAVHEERVARTPPLACGELQL